MMGVLVTGGNSQVGKALRTLQWPKSIDVQVCGRDELDITDTEAVIRRLSGGNVDVLINTAAYTNVEQSEDAQTLAFRLNAEAPGVLARACDKAGVALLHVSTDYVFDGAKDGAYNENDPVNPLGTYAKSKEGGESAVREALDRHVILRTAWVFSPFNVNFVKTMLCVGAERPELKVVVDQLGNPTAALDIARALACIAERVVENGHWGTYHFAGSPGTTWYDFAESIFDIAAKKWGRRPMLHPIRADEWPSKVDRPANTRLNCARIMRDYGIEAPDWRASLVPVVAELLHK